MRIVFMGTPEFAVPSLERLVFSGCRVVMVYTQPDKPAGRGRSLVPSAIKRVAQNLELPLLQPVNFRNPEAVAQLAGLQPDVIVVAAFGQILPKSVLEIPRCGCVNIHPSLLPRYRGASPIAAAILAGDRFAGISLMLMDESMDTGPILARAQISISGLDTMGSLTSKLSLISAQLLLEVLPSWLRGEITPLPQPEAQAIYTQPITKEEGEIDWRLPAVDIWRRVRAFYPWPGCYTGWQGKRLKIIEAVPLSGEQNAEVGRVVATEGREAAFGVGTGDGVLGIRQVQIEGKRAMSADEFLRGQRDFLGAILRVS